MPYVYIGRTHSFIGKSIWEIAGSLKNYGVGRMVIRQRFMTLYSEPCFMRIVSAKPLMDEDNIKGTFHAEHVFRGRNYGVVDLSRVAYKTDYQLIPKHEEYKYIKAFEEFKLPEDIIYAPTAEMPPLLKLLAEQRGHHETVFNISMETEVDPEVGARIDKGETPLKGRKKYKGGETLKVGTRIAKEGETPNAQLSISLGIPVCNKLYEGVIFDQPLPE